MYILIASKAKRLLHEFRCNHEMLCHGDLHTGSVMCNPDVRAVKIIDSEFAFFGPIAFDVGMFLANLIMSFEAHRELNHDDYASYVQQQIKLFWQAIEKEFETRIIDESIDFCAMEMLRRTIGVAHVDDVDKIDNLEQKTKTEANILQRVIDLFHRNVQSDDLKLLRTCTPSLQRAQHDQ